MTSSITLKLPNNESLYLPEEWVKRWDYFTNLLSEIDVTDLHWTAHTLEELESWIMLNKRMDSGYTGGVEEEYDGELESLIILSDHLDLFRFFLPRDGEWLLHVYIDEGIPLAVRGELYRELGYHLRATGIRRVYHDIESDDPSYDHIHGNLQVGLDPAYGYLPAFSESSQSLRHRCTVDRATYPPELVEALIVSTPLNIMTGILHTAWKYTRSTSYTTREDLGCLREIPWDLIRWGDLIDLAPNAFVYNWEVRKLISALVRKSTGDYAAAMGLYGQNVNTLPPNLLETVPNNLLREEYTTVRPITEENDQYNLRLVLAGRCLPGVSSDYEFRRIDYTRVTILTGEGGIIRPCVPNFPLLLERLIFLFENEGPVYYHNLYSLGRILVNRSVNTTIEEIPSQIIYTMVSGSGSAVTLSIDSLEYEEICREINRTLGSRLLLTVVEDATNHIESLEGRPMNRMQRIEVRKAQVLAQVALDIVEASSTPDFVTYPTVMR